MRALRSRLAESLRSAAETHLALLETLEADSEQDPLVEGLVEGTVALAQGRAAPARRQHPSPHQGIRRSARGRSRRRSGGIRRGLRRENSPSGGLSGPARWDIKPPSRHRRCSSSDRCQGRNSPRRRWFQPRARLVRLTPRWRCTACGESVHRHPSRRRGRPGGATPRRFGCGVEIQRVGALGRDRGQRSH